MGDTPDPKPDPKKDDPEPDDDLGDSGKRALAAERRAKREAEQKAKDLEARLKELEDKDKSEGEKLAAKLAAAEKDAADAKAAVLRYEVAGEKGLTPAQARRLVGTTKEELLADADDFLEALKPAGGGSGGPAPSKPKEDLKGGGDPDEAPVVVDPSKLAESVPRR